MPIRKELRAFYGKTWREVTRPRILARAGNCCEECGVPDRTIVWRSAGMWRLRHYGAPWHAEDGRQTDAGDRVASTREVHIVLTIAHLDHTPGHDEDSNLKALCQWHHLSHDKQQHHESRAARKDLARPLLREAMSC